MEAQIWFLFTCFADQKEVVARNVGAIFKIAGFAAAVRAFADNSSVIAEIDRHAFVEHV